MNSGDQEGLTRPRGVQVYAGGRTGAPRPPPHTHQSRERRAGGHTAHIRSHSAAPMLINVLFHTAGRAEAHCKAHCGCCCCCFRGRRVHVFHLWLALLILFLVPLNEVDEMNGSGWDFNIPPVWRQGGESVPASVLRSTLELCCASGGLVLKGYVTDLH